MTGVLCSLRSGRCCSWEWVAPGGHGDAGLPTCLTAAFWLCVTSLGLGERGTWWLSHHPSKHTYTAAYCSHLGLLFLSLPVAVLASCPGRNACKPCAITLVGRHPCLTATLRGLFLISSSLSSCCPELSKAGQHIPSHQGHCLPDGVHTRTGRAEEQCQGTAEGQQRDSVPREHDVPDSHQAAAPSPRASCPNLRVTKPPCRPAPGATVTLPKPPRAWGHCLGPHPAASLEGKPCASHSRFVFIS